MRHNTVIWFLSIITSLAGIGGFVHWRRHLERRRFFYLCFMRYYRDLPAGCRNVLMKFAQSDRQVELSSSNTFTEILVEDGIIEKYSALKDQGDPGNFFRMNKNCLIALKALVKSHRIN